MDEGPSLSDRARRNPRDFGLAHLLVLLVGAAACGGLLACIVGYLRS